MTDDHPRHVTLPGGRRLAYAEYGDPAGLPVFYCHGLPGSRLECGRCDVDTIFRRARARLIAPDRPGIGASDFCPGRRLLDWPADMGALADALGLDRFAILAVSGGGPYALACASVLPARVLAVLLAASVGPGDQLESAVESRLGRWVLGLGRSAPWLLKFYFDWLARQLQHDPEAALLRINAHVSRPDWAILAEAATRAQMIRSLQEALAPGPWGVAWEFHLFTQPWGFSPEACRVPVDLWHGEADRTVPPSLGRWLAARLPDCRPHFLPQVGHFLAIARCAELVDSLMALSRRRLALGYGINPAASRRWCASAKVSA